MLRSFCWGSMLWRWYYSSEILLQTWRECFAFVYTSYQNKNLCLMNATSIMVAPILVGIVGNLHVSYMLSTCMTFPEFWHGQCAIPWLRKIVPTTQYPMNCVGLHAPRKIGCNDTIRRPADVIAQDTLHHEWFTHYPRAT